ncbi:MAG: hypothetical protein Q8S55_18010, partial [Methylococcaceae bacterium]|nr:hypothetical protein [Methylococcaceae bacterium]
VAIATVVLVSVLAPTGEQLSFSSPKESSQRKGDPDSANFLRFSLLARVFEEPSLALRKRAASLPLPFRAYFTKSCDARGGITGEKPLCVTSVNQIILPYRPIQWLPRGRYSAIQNSTRLQPPAFNI